ncbi:TonB-dependent receptor [Rapidithrix thailandica]|uniref:TonB-dependent receptor n=1 Tax=Rapidithrix thailandica TaxID=413964 RepID=A0AAW9S6I2_9BACT
MKYEKILHVFCMISKYGLYGFIGQLLCYTVLFAANSNAQNIREVYLSIEAEDVALERIFSKIEESTTFKFSYSNNKLNLKERISITAKQQTVAQVLENIALQTGLRFKQINRNIFVNKNLNRSTEVPSSLVVQEVIIKGIVTDETGGGLPGVSVVVTGTTTGTVTDIEGNYQLKIPSDAASLSFSYIGYKTIEQPVNGRSEINVQMELDVQSLEEVVVVGYGTQKKGDVTGAMSAVKVADVQKVPGGNVANMMQGQVAGVNISPGTGAPGSAPVVRIRGMGTIGSNDPLYIIDGIPGDITYINPADIESINVLKDASAATIYGSRASNGVILVTTKRGKKGAPVVTLDAFAGVQTLSNGEIEVMNSKELAQVTYDRYINAGVDSKDIPSWTQNPENYADTDWQDLMFRNGVEQKYDLGIAGGSDQLTYSFSGGYYNTKGLIINTDYERYNARLNLNYKFLKDRLQVGQILAYSRVNKNNIGEPTGGGDAGFSPLLDILEENPLKEAYDPNSPNGFATPNPDLNSYGNVLGERMLEKDQNQLDYVQVNMFADLKLFKGLNYRYQMGFNIENGHDFYHLAAYDFGAQAQNENPLLSENRYRQDERVFTHTLTYEHDWDNHYFKVLGGYSTEKVTYRSTGGSNRKLASEKLESLSSGIGDQAATGINTSNALQSFFGRVNYSFKDKYFVQGSVRRDGSSRFNSDNQYGVFYSMSLGWQVTEESFFNVPFISDLKPRFSYGTLGNQAIGDFKYLNVITIGENVVNYPFGMDASQKVAIGAIGTELPTPDIQWEETATANYGLDLGLWDDQLTFTMEYFKAKTTKMLVTVPVPATSGITVWPYTNGGSMENQGWEFAATFAKREGEFNFDITANLAATKNKITKLGFADESITEGFIDFQNHPTTLSEVGGEIGRFYLYKVDGIFQSEEEINAHTNAGGELLQPNAVPGDFRFVDVNGDGNLNDEDKDFFDSGLPRLDYGLNFNATYRNFDLSIFIQGTAGNKMYNGVKYWLYRQGVSKDLLNAWTPDRPNTDVPRNTLADNNSNFRPSNYFLEDASYLRLRNIQLGYTLPSALTDKIKVAHARVYVGGLNLLTFTKYEGFDPGLSNFGNFTRGVDRGLYPLNKSIVAGMNLRF